MNLDCVLLHCVLVHCPLLRCAPLPLGDAPQDLKIEQSVPQHKKTKSLDSGADEDGRDTNGQGPDSGLPPSKCQDRWSLTVLEHVRESVWKVKGLTNTDWVLSSLARAGKKACLGLMHAAPEKQGSNKQKMGHRRPQYPGGGPELKIHN